MSKYSLTQRILEHREVKAISLIKDSIVTVNFKPKIFDLGCGDGYFMHAANKIINADIDWQGGEPSDFQNKNAQLLTGFPIHDIDVEGILYFKDKEFDLIYSGEVIEHIFNPDNMIREIHRLLKINGRVILTTPNMNSWLSRILFLFGLYPLTYECSTVSSLYGFGPLKSIKKQSWPIGHVRLFNKNSLQDLLSANGFSNIKFYGSLFYYLPKYLKPVDRFFSFFPSLSSVLIVTAQKKSKKQLF